MTRQILCSEITNISTSSRNSAGLSLQVKSPPHWERPDMTWCANWTRPCSEPASVSQPPRVWRDVRGVTRRLSESYGQSVHCRASRHTDGLTLSARPMNGNISIIFLISISISAGQSIESDLSFIINEGFNWSEWLLLIEGDIFQIMYNSYDCWWHLTDTDQKWWTCPSLSWSASCWSPGGWPAGRPGSGSRSTRRSTRGRVSYCSASSTTSRGTAGHRLSTYSRECPTKYFPTFIL